MTVKVGGTGPKATRFRLAAVTGGGCAFCATPYGNVATASANACTLGKA